MSQEYATVIPLRKNVIDTFVKGDRLFFAKQKDGSVYVSNGHYLMKTDKAGLDYLTAQVNKRRRTPDIAVTENKRILDYVKNAKGAFELTQKPHEVEMGKDCTACFFMDDKQYFAYDKRFISILKNFDNRLFVDDNRFYDVYSHGLIAKSQTGEVLGVALPMTVTDAMYEKLADVLPLKVKRKSEIERIKENPDNDPYIGKEYSDSKNNYIVSAKRLFDGVDMYVIPQTISNGKVTGHADLVRADEMEKQIARWEADRAGRKPGINKQMEDAAKQAAKYNAARPAPEKGGKGKNERS